MAKKVRLWVFICLGVFVVAAVVGTLLPERGRPPSLITFQRLHGLWMNVEQLNRENGRLPSLDELMEFDPSMRDGSSILDGWGRKIMVVRGEKAWVFVSKGADGILNTSDDMVCLAEPRGRAPRPE